jgi:hypothetical protein
MRSRSSPYPGLAPTMRLIETSPFREIADAGSVDEPGVQILLSRAKADLLRVGDIRWRLLCSGSYR